ncbi:MAG: oligosaccharide flippase family protein [Patescibacteria group bacterium]
MIGIVRRYAVSLFTLLRSQLAQEAGYLMVGNIVQAGSIFLIFAFLARTLPADQFGQFTLVNAFLGLISAFSDLGLNTGMVRYGAEAVARQEWHRAKYIFQVNKEWRLIAGGVFVLGGIALVPWLATTVWRDESLTTMLRIAFVGGLGMVLQSYVTSVQIARRQFLASSVLLIVTAVLRLLILLVCWRIGVLSALSATVAMVLAPSIVALLAELTLPALPATRQVVDRRTERRSLLSFSAWVAGSAIFVALTQRIDLALLGHFLPLATVGTYAVAQQLAFGIRLGTSALTTALLPRVATLGLAEIPAYIRRVLYYAPAVVVGAVPLIALVHLLVPLIFGARYQEAVFLFDILLAGQVISLVVNPLSLILFRLEKPSVFTALNALQLIVVGAAGWMLIPRFGVAGAAMSAILSQVVGAVVTGSYLSFALARIARARSAE